MAGGMNQAMLKVVSDNRGHVAFMGAVNGFFNDLNSNGYKYIVSYAYEKELYIAFVTYWKG